MTGRDACSTSVSLKWNADRIWLSARWWLLAIAILHQVLYRCAFGFAGPDFAKQVSAAQSLIDGYGLTCPSANVTDLSQPIRTQLLGWPPGYSLVVACALYATGDLWIAVLAIHIIAVALLYAAWFVILELLQPHVTGKAKLVLWIFWGFAGYPIKLLSGAEILALAMFSWAVISCLFAASGRRVLLHAGLAGVCLAGACAFRYAYWPLAVVPPLAIIVSSFWSDHRRQQLVSGVVCGLVSCSLLGALIFSQQLRTGQITWLQPPDRVRLRSLG